MEYKDYAIAFAKGIKETQEAGEDNSTLLTPKKIIDILGYNPLQQQMPHNMLRIFKDENVYIRKLRGEDLFRAWWLPNGETAQGRGIKK